jgi:hypothetical protein
MCRGTARCRVCNVFAHPDPRNFFTILWLHFLRAVRPTRILQDSIARHLPVAVPRPRRDTDSCRTHANHRAAVMPHALLKNSLLDRYVYHG